MNAHRRNHVPAPTLAHEPQQPRMPGCSRSTPIAVFLKSAGAEFQRTNWNFTNVLTQIGLGYPVLFLMWRRPVAVQVTVVACLLVVTLVASTSSPTAGLVFWLVCLWMARQKIYIRV